MFAVSDIIVTFASSLSLAEPTLVSFPRETGEPKGVKSRAKLV